MPDAKYRRIAEDLRRRIESGALPPGSQLPTESELSLAHDASRNTVRDAVKWLMSRGLVETRPGQGTFVARRPVPFVTTLSGDWQEESGLGGGEGLAALNEVRDRQRTTSMSVPAIAVRRATGYVADRLEVEPGTNVISRQQNRFIDGQPWSLQVTYYPMDLVTRGAVRLIEAEVLQAGAVKYLEEALHLKQVGFRDLITVRPPDAQEVAFFRLPDDGRISVYVILRTGFATDGGDLVPFRLTESVFPCDRNQFVINAGAVPGRLSGPAEV